MIKHLLIVCSLLFHINIKAMETSPRPSSSQELSSRSSLEEEVSLKNYISMLECFIKGDWSIDSKKRKQVTVTFFDKFSSVNNHITITRSFDEFLSSLRKLFPIAVESGVRELPFQLQDLPPAESDIKLSLQPDIEERVFCCALARFLVFMEARDLSRPIFIIQSPDADLFTPSKPSANSSSSFSLLI